MFLMRTGDLRMRMQHIHDLLRGRCFKLKDPVADLLRREAFIDYLFQIAVIAQRHGIGERHDCHEDDNACKCALFMTQICRQQFEYTPHCAPHHSIAASHAETCVSRCFSASAV